MTVPTIRAADPNVDAAACAAIYAPYVRETVISFEDDPPDVAEMASRIRDSHAWLVAEADGELLGYVSAGSFKARVAYRFSCEVSVYLAPAAWRRGLASQMYQSLFTQLSAQGFHMACAGVALPNDASMGLHRRLGFEPVGVEREVGYKFGRWIDVARFQRRLS